MKALYFLRHYNDIDHVTPVIDKWVRSGHEADVVLMGDKAFMQDYRICHLASLADVRVAWIGEILTAPQLLRMRVQKLFLDRHFRAAVPDALLGLLGRVLNEKSRTGFWSRVAAILLDRSFPRGKQGVVAFDWISGNSVFPIEFVKIVTSLARGRGFGTVSLPHGDSPHANYLVRTDEFSMAPREKFSPAAMFDRVVVPNELCATRFRPFMPDEAVAVLGSPRYCDEWLDRLAGLLPASPLKKNGSAMKIVVFLRKRDFSIFWDEAERVLEMIAAFEGVEIIVKAHTRGGWRQPLTGNRHLRNLANVRFVAGEVHSSHLLDWADVIIDIATSVAFEAVKSRKPVMAADYLHAGISTVADYMPECAWHCRDDAWIKIHKLLEEGCEGFYVEEHREKFLREIVDVPDRDVLQRFVTLLESLAVEDKTR